nr:MAG TPA: hypothetical protein [Bacteriophage sp.]
MLIRYCHVPYKERIRYQSHLHLDNPFHQVKSTLCYEFNRFR